MKIGNYECKALIGSGAGLNIINADMIPEEVEVESCSQVASTASGDKLAIIGQVSNIKLKSKIITTKLMRW